LAASAYAQYSQAAQQHANAAAAYGVQPDYSSGLLKLKMKTQLIDSIDKIRKINLKT
jgi:hypothetical protein